jgi:hypothetical protein
MTFLTKGLLMGDPARPLGDPWRIFSGVKLFSSGKDISKIYRKVARRFEIAKNGRKNREANVLCQGLTPLFVLVMIM